MRLTYYILLIFAFTINFLRVLYGDLKHSYQISLVVNAPIIEDDVFVYHFKHYDGENCISLGGRSHIITIELSKLEQIAKKPVEEVR